MKKLMRLRYRKGFTLVECVIAIAVFAVLTSMVVMVMGNSTKLSKEAAEAEEDLNNIVQNVVQDDTHRVYGDDSKTLRMGFAAENDFNMTFSTVDGYKSFIKCPGCGALYNNLDYLAYIYDTTTYKNWTPESDKSKYKISYWFGQGLDCQNFVCPECEKSFAPSSLTMRCEACTNECALSLNFTEASTTGNWDYNRYKGNYVCRNCKSEGVVQIVDEVDKDGNLTGKKIPITNATSDGRLMVSGISANALRYGIVEQYKDKEEIKKLTTITGAEATNNFTATLKYTPNTNAAKPGIYTLTIDGVSGLGTGAATIKFALPGYYIPRIVGGNADGETGHALASAQGLDNDHLEKPSGLTIANVDSSSSSHIEVKFTLTNYKNDNSFEDDYKVDAGVSAGGQTALTKLWFASGSDAVSIKDGFRDESNISMKTAASGSTTSTTTG